MQVEIMIIDNNKYEVFYFGFHVVLVIIITNNTHRNF